MRTALASAAFQVQVFRRTPADLHFFILVPLQTVIFQSLVRFDGRPDLAAYAVLAPAVLAVLGMALFGGGELIAYDRAQGIFEGLLAAPVSLAAVLLGRITTITVLSLLTLVESWLVTGLLFGTWVGVAHPGLFLAVIAAMAFATAGATTALASLFVLSRSVRSFQNSMSYPLLLLGGAFVPADLLPQWLQPLTRVVYLSWATDLLRDAMGSAPVADVPFRVAMVVLLGAALYAVGLWLFHAVLRRTRTDGSVGLA